MSLAPQPQHDILHNDTQHNRLICDTQHVIVTINVTDASGKNKLDRLSLGGIFGRDDHLLGEATSLGPRPQYNDILHNNTQHKGLICDTQHK